MLLLLQLYLISKIYSTVHHTHITLSHSVNVEVFVERVLGHLKRIMYYVSGTKYASTKMSDVNSDVKFKYFNCFSNYLLIRLLSRPKIYEYLLCVQISDTHYDRHETAISVITSNVDFPSTNSSSNLSVVFIMMNAGRHSVVVILTKNM